MTSGKPQMSGRILKAPEGHLAPALLEQARKARRSFMGQALAMGAGVSAAVAASAASTDSVGVGVGVGEGTRRS